MNKDRMLELNEQLNKTTLNEVKYSKRVEQLMSIVKNQQHAKVENMDVDMNSASFYIQIWTELGEKNRKHLDNMNIAQAFDIVMKLVGKIRR